MAKVKRICQICERQFDIKSIDDPRTLCPECVEKLMELLYPDTFVADGIRYYKVPDCTWK